jgi:hypothetical protein
LKSRIFFSTMGKIWGFSGVGVTVADARYSLARGVLPPVICVVGVWFYCRSTGHAAD